MKARRNNTFCCCLLRIKSLHSQLHYNPHTHFRSMWMFSEHKTVSFALYTAAYVSIKALTCLLLHTASSLVFVVLIKYMDISFRNVLHSKIMKLIICEEIKRVFARITSYRNSSSSPYVINYTIRYIRV